MNNTNSVDTASLILQIISLQILFKDYNNSDIMQELQNQDEKYLKQILNNQQEILNILNERRNEDARKIKREN